MLRTFFVTALVIAISAQSASAASEMREKFASLAEKILRVTGQQPVAVGIFSPTGLRETNSGPGLEAILTEELRRLSPQSVQENAPIEVKGDYAYVKSDAPRLQGLKVIQIAVRLINTETNQPLVNLALETTLDHTESVAEMLQVTASLPPQGSKEERNAELDRQRTNPAVHIHGANRTLISSTPQSPYAVEILARPLADPKRDKPIRQVAREQEGRAFVEIPEGRLYEVKVYNNSDREAAVSLSIDGLDMFHFSKDRDAAGNPSFSHLILPPKSSDTIVGWHNSVKGKENYLSFLVTAYGQGAVSKAGIAARGNVGVIHVQFSTCHLLGKGGTRSVSNETGFGPPRDVQQKPVQREIEPPHDFVSIRYTRPQE